MKRLMSNRQAGFTIIEVAVVAPIMILTLAVFLNFLITLYVTTLQQNGLTEMISDNDKALSVIRNDLYLTDGFRTTNDANLTDPNAPSGGWSFSTSSPSTNYRTFIAGVLGTTKVQQDPTRDIVYLNQYGCNVPSLNPPMVNNYIYYTKQTGVDSDGTTPVYGLYRRILVDTSSTCGTAIQKQTCPTAVGSCPADTLLVTGVMWFIVTYYAADSSTPLSVYPSGGNPALVQTASVAKVLLRLHRTFSGDTGEYSWYIYVKKLNS